MEVTLYFADCLITGPPSNAQQPYTPLSLLGIVAYAECTE